MLLQNEHAVTQTPIILYTRSPNALSSWCTYPDQPVHLWRNVDRLTLATQSSPPHTHLSPHHHTSVPHHHTSVPPPPHSSPTPPPSDCFAAVSGHFPRGSEMGMSFFTMLPHVKGDNGMQRLHVIALLKWNMYTHNFFCCIISGIGLWMKKWTAVEDDEVLDESN